MRAVAFELSQKNNLFLVENFFRVFIKGLLCRSKALNEQQFRGTFFKRFNNTNKQINSENFYKLIMNLFLEMSLMNVDSGNYLYCYMKINIKVDFPELPLNDIIRKKAFLFARKITYNQDIFKSVFSFNVPTKPINSNNSNEKIAYEINVPTKPINSSNSNEKIAYEINESIQLNDSNNSNERIANSRTIYMTIETSPQLYNQLKPYSKKLLDILEIERYVEEKQNMLNIKEMTIKDLNDQEIIIKNPSLVHIEHRTNINKFILNFSRFPAACKLLKGDDVGIYAYNSSIKYLAEPLYTASVFYISDHLISIMSDCCMNRLPNYPSFCIVKHTSQGAFVKIKKNLQNIYDLQIPEYCENLFNVIFKNKQISHNVSRSQSMLNLTFFNSSINVSQKSAVEMSFINKELSLIHGPPGTGKTSTLVEIILQNIIMSNKILVCSHSNLGVDNIAEKIIFYSNKHKDLKGLKLCRLGKPAKLLESILDVSMDACLNRNPEYQEVIRIIREDEIKLQNSSLNEVIRKRVLARRKELLDQVDIFTKQIIKESNIIFCTNVGAGDNSLVEYVKNSRNYFDLVILDEAAQAPEYSCWLPIMLGKKLIMAGDHKQLPPIMLSDKAQKELELTLFEKMNNHYSTAGSVQLRTQYRMSSKIMDFPSKKFYDGNLIAHESCASGNITSLISNSSLNYGRDYLNLRSSSLILIDTKGFNCLEKTEHFSYINKSEAKITTFLIDYLCNLGIKSKDIGIITPYNSQVRLLKNKLSMNNRELDISSVDGFQGREKEIIILSLVRSNNQRKIGFVNDLKRINVALTRAKKMIILIIDSNTFSSDKFFKELLGHYNLNAQIIEVPSVI